MPDSISSCGVLNAPPARITSRWRERLRASSPAAALGRGCAPYSRSPFWYSTPMARFVSSNSTRVASAFSSIFSRSGCCFAHVEQALARADALVVVGRQRRVAQRRSASSRHDAPVVGIEQRCRAGRRSHRRAELAFKRVPAPTRAMRLRRSRSRERVARRSPSRSAASRPSHGGWDSGRDGCSSRSAGRCRQFSSRSKYVAHRLGAPRRIAGQIGDLVPVASCADRRGSSRCARCSRRACRRADSSTPSPARRRQLSVLRIALLACGRRSGARRSPSACARSRSRAVERRARRSRRAGGCAGVCGVADDVADRRRLRAAARGSRPRPGAPPRCRRRRPSRRRCSRRRSRRRCGDIG